ncbi:hypothetical protein TNCV_2338471 [Trichonephila clavipes]|nr:hypothetical protein TNCV_2338471 [Trichonephila clavipes]
MVKASSRTSKSTVAYSAKKGSETGIKCTQFVELPIKSPDTSPMNFCAFSLLKRVLGKRHPIGLKGIWKMVQEDWSKTRMTVLRKSLHS